MYLLLASAAGYAQAQTLDCGNRLISTGDTIAEVAAICGNPTHIDHSSIIRSASVWGGGQAGQSNSIQIEVPVEVWLYNRGPNKFMRRVRFEDGKIVLIETLGYGYIEGSN
jgi:hypothetical protein